MPIYKGSGGVNMAAIYYGSTSMGRVYKGTDLVWEKAPSGPTPVFMSNFQNSTDGSTSFTDEATGKTITANGNAQIDTAQFKYGVSSVLFDGTGDYLSMADSADWNFGAGAWEMEGWFRFNSLAGAHHLMGQRSTTDMSVALSYSNTTGQLILLISTNGSGTTTRISVGPSFSAGVWYHLLANYNGTKYRVFKDGVMIGSATATDTLYDSTQPFTIGARSTGADDFNGWCGGARVWKGVAPHASDSSFTPPTGLMTV